MNKKTIHKSKKNLPDEHLWKNYSKLCDKIWKLKPGESIEVEKKGLLMPEPYATKHFLVWFNRKANCISKQMDKMQRRIKFLEQNVQELTFLCAGLEDRLRKTQHFKCITNEALCCCEPGVLDIKEEL